MWSIKAISLLQHVMEINAAGSTDKNEHNLDRDCVEELSYYWNFAKAAYYGWIGKCLPYSTGIDGGDVIQTSWSSKAFQPVSI